MEVNSSSSDEVPGLPETKKKRGRPRKSEEEKRETNRRKVANKRARKTEDEKAATREADRARKRDKKKKTTVEPKEAMRSEEILNGSYHVPELKDTNDDIGTMSLECQYCGALKFKGESPSSCCQGGKVLIKPFPRPPDQLMNIWFGDGEDDMLFRKNSRYINNAVCLTSIKSSERRGGWQPSVIFQGRVEHRVGPLLPAEGQDPRYAQLYVQDSALETSLRFRNMQLPVSLSNAQKLTLGNKLEMVQQILHDCNPFIQDFKQIMEIPEDEISIGKIVISAKNPSGEHSRRYNEQTNLKEIRILTNSQPHDLVLQKRGGGLQFVHDMNPKGMPLHFTLLFPHGTYGWDEDVRHVDGKRRVTAREFFTFHLNLRRNNDNQNYLHMAGKLFQEWLCMGWIQVENQRLLYQTLNQKALRADSYKSLREAVAEKQREIEPRTDALYPDDHETPRIGRKILSSSFMGGPRWFNAKFQDGMAICREYHKPDYFITMTCNPKWPEIMEGLFNGQEPQDRPELVARVFKHKKDQLMKDLTAGGLFGKAVAHMHVIEFQKRGLPHAHILLILADHDRTLTKELVDSLVVAELPPDPELADTPMKMDERKIMENIVLTNMLHGPCGKDYPNAPCMDNGKCSKNFPKEFHKETIVDPENYYAIYKRRSPDDGGRTVILPKTNRKVDNSWVVPYNPYLSRRFQCHINVECCTSTKAAKYLYKYVTKGNDRAMVATEVEGEQRDEIAEYQDLRSVGSSEATWHLLSFPITERFPGVQALRVHLKEQQQVVFDESTEAEALESQRETELTAFFAFNQKMKDSNADINEMPKYIDMPKGNVYDKSKKEWRKRKQNRGEAMIGRVHTVNPVSGDVYYLRLLLHDDFCRGKTSFEDMLQLPSGQICETYKQVCCELGLLNDDREWHRVLEESAATKMCPQIRELFIIILIFCQPSNPRTLFDEHWSEWIDDFENQGRRTGLELTESQKYTMLLLDLELRLQSYEMDLSKCGLPVPTADELAQVCISSLIVYMLTYIIQVHNIVSTEPAIIREEMDYNLEDLSAVVQEREPNFTDEQRVIFQAVMEAVTDKSQLLIFIDARGGCGKTFLLNTILSAVRSTDGGSIALAMATTGIAANLLTLGRTFHSRLKAPLIPSEESTLHIPAQSNLAKLIQKCKIMMIDEATMLDRYLLEALDRTLRDLCDQDKPFGGKILVLAGDFRQCLPVVPGASRVETVGHCINQSHLWRHFDIMRLSVNMRILASGDKELEEFDKWSLSIGNGEMKTLNLPEKYIGTKIIPNSSKNTNSEGQAMKKFCDKLFPDLSQNIGNHDWLEGRTILAPTNKEVNMLNECLEEKLPGITDKFSSADTLQNNQDLLRFNQEYLHTLTPTGFPTHDIRLKKGMPLMLMRNLNPREGLCNGTKLVFIRSVANKVLECQVVGSLRTVLIPRITFMPKVGEFPFEWQRRQFPVKPAFAITINKSQGQTLKKAGIWLRTQTFAHGQLYVACSRVGKPENIQFAVIQDKHGNVEGVNNVVYTEVLIDK